MYRRTLSSLKSLSDAYPCELLFFAERSSGISSCWTDFSEVDSSLSSWRSTFVANCDFFCLKGTFLSIPEDFDVDFVMRFEFLLAFEQDLYLRND